MGRKRLTTEQFIKHSKNIHGNKYDYSQVKYIDMHTKIKITCLKHGAFKLLPYSHTVRKTGCPKCGILKAKKSRSIGLEEFKKRANQVHQGIYKYVKNSYAGTAYKITIICPIHGKFQQKASNHLDGFGCKKCAMIKRSLNKKI